MVDTARAGFPSDMYRAAHHGDVGWFETQAEDLVESVKNYIHENPASAMLCVLGIGFVLGWKLKPW